MSISTANTATTEDQTADVADALDREWLGNWIQPQHLEDEAVRSYREAFAAHPANLLVIKNFLKEPEAAGLSNFINNEAEVSTMYGLYSSVKAGSANSSIVTETEWTAAEEQDRFYKVQKFLRLSEQNKLTPNLAMYIQFLAAFKNPKFRRFFELVTGLKFDQKSETYHFYIYKKGDFLGPHDDRGGKYSLAFMMYLTPDWETRFGGSLNMVLPGGEISKMAPEYNNLVIFDVQAKAKHFVSKIEDCIGDRGRSAFSGWLHKPA